MALSAVHRLGGRFGRGRLIDHLLGKTKEVTDHEAAMSTYGIGQDLSAVQWRDLVEQLLFEGLLREDPNDGRPLIGLGDAESVRQVYRGERQVLARPERAGMIWPALSPDGAHVLYPRMDLHPAGEQVWLVDLDGTEDREIVNAGDARKADALWSPDSAQIVITAETETHRRVGVMRVGGNDIRWLIDDPERDISGAYWPRNSDRIVVTETQAARDVSWLVDPATGAQRRAGRRRRARSSGGESAALIRPRSQVRVLARPPGNGWGEHPASASGAVA